MSSQRRFRGGLEGDAVGVDVFSGYNNKLFLLISFFRVVRHYENDRNVMEKQIKGLRDVVRETV